ncbi:DEHA2B11286p [Debaryomyces hansenii CBS767]|uniref:AP-1 complex subunit gamma n=1 Tax=Debaryomyces hansenii (strain ATCC 36239 / CBS 767 / BCRC 21394 / JCM 1990 / NBRC 0083 / IGC 2968) TaxID=284592 RepID=Q6BWH7_DEBHA|nr:DEHA2B11286p [Debaryomyces hansenii CBS767]CAG85446.2 DEHA2B11286p [Debaryomyces hansenii CBS767]|eukprot:XP_457442.2 DEHA2B11286p [Debaryomyces hansenii CBS767]
MGSLKSFIKAVRKSKTIADERAVVMKESASIRTSFRDAKLDQTTRRINISKLLYLYIMGEKTHFGQVECIKLLASPRFADKRLGYMATMLLLDENQEVLTLLTNSLDNDMQHPNAFIVGLALCCLGNIASPELARDLYTNVDKIITTNNLYLKKKACIVAAKLIEKDPDLSEIFMPKVPQLISDKSPGVLLGALRLIQALYFASPEHRENLIKTIPKIVGHLKRVASSGYIPDYDVLGISDPFLQVSLLTTIRILAVDENCPPKYLEEINDILTQVASNIESGKNAAHAILYECVKTIFAIQSDQSLKILGVNLLGKFLSTKDNNTRYVALDTLLTVINIEPLAVQRHRTTIVNCLSDGDISIRRRALELSFAILNEQNIRVLVREILLFLENCRDNELKPYISSQLTTAANKFAPNEKWHFDTLIRMLKLSGNFITPDIISNILALIMQCNDLELKKHVVGRLLSLCLEDSTQYGLSLITVWCLGEYVDLILDGNVEVNGKQVPVTDKLILKLIDELINNSTYSDQETVHLVTYILTAIIKLSIKFKNPDSIEKLRLILNSRAYDNNLEIQIRAAEYQEIFAQDTQLKKGLLARMPAPKIKARESLSLQNTNTHRTKPAGHSHNDAGVPSSTNDLLDLLDDNNDASNVSNNHQPISNNDLLSDLFAGPSNPTQSQASSHAKSSNNGSILDLFDSPSAAQSPVQSNFELAQSSAQLINAFSNSNIAISFLPKSFPQNGQATMEAHIKSNSPSSSIEQFQLLIAVPKTQKLSISSTSGGDTLVNGSDIKQVLKIVGKQGSKVKLRVKAKYILNGETVEDLFDFAGFSSTL